MYSENLEFWMIMKSLENFHDLLSVLSIVVAVYIHLPSVKPYYFLFVVCGTGHENKA